MSTSQMRPVTGHPLELVEDDFRKALEEVDTFMDIHIRDLVQLYHMAYKHQCL